MILVPRAGHDLWASSTSGLTDSQPRPRPSAPTAATPSQDCCGWSACRDAPRPTPAHEPPAPNEVRPRDHGASLDVGGSVTFTLLVQGAVIKRCRLLAPVGEAPPAAAAAASTGPFCSFRDRA